MSNGSYVLFVPVPIVCVCLCTHCSHGFSFSVCTCVLPCIHDRVRSLYLLPVFPQVWSHLNRSYLMPGDWWCEGDLLVMSEEQAAGGKLFCPCLLRALLLFFILFALFPSTALYLARSVLLSPCSALLDLAVKLPCSEQCYISDVLPSYSYQCHSVETY